MRKAVLVVAVAGLLASLQPASAANLTQTFTIQYPAPIYPVPGDPIEGENGAMSASCATSGITLDDYRCEKSTYTRVARCLYLTDPAVAQDRSTKTGVFGAVIEINGAAVRGNPADDRDNNTFDLFVTNKTAENAVGQVDLPDVDVVFYAELGECLSDVEGPQGVYVPLGRTPVGFSSNTIFSGSYTTYGDEMGRAFPSGVYQDPDDPTKLITANKYFAIVSVVGGVGAEITWRCRENLAKQSGKRECGSNWFKFL